jgi:hypothetical protein
MAAHNYDGDMLTDEVAQVRSSLVCSSCASSSDCFRSVDCVVPTRTHKTGLSPKFFFIYRLLCICLQVHRSPGFITSNLIGKNDDGSLIKGTQLPLFYCESVNTAVCASFLTPSTRPIRPQFFA